jgi:hypothetical protein
MASARRASLARSCFPLEMRGAAVDRRPHDDDDGEDDERHPPGAGRPAQQEAHEPGQARERLVTLGRGARRAIV